MSERLIKVNNLLRAEVSRALQSKLRLADDVIITVVSAEVSRTLEHASIKISVFPKKNAEAVLQTINAQIYNVQQILNKRLAMRPVPKLMFKLDDTGEKIAKIEKILKKAVE